MFLSIGRFRLLTRSIAPLPKSCKSTRVQVPRKTSPSITAGKGKSSEDTKRRWSGGTAQLTC